MLNDEQIGRSQHLYEAILPFLLVSSKNLKRNMFQAVLCRKEGHISATGSVLKTGKKNKNPCPYNFSILQNGMTLVLSDGDIFVFPLYPTYSGFIEECVF